MRRVGGAYWRRAGRSGRKGKWTHPDPLSFSPAHRRRKPYSVVGSMWKAEVRNVPPWMISQPA